MKISAAGEAFIAVHEGRVHKAYRDSVGVLTIGYGNTMRSAIFASYWRVSRGHDLRLGDTITTAECDMLLTKLLNEEYCPTIDAKCKPANQPQFDSAASVSYNCGSGSLNDGWARTLASGNVAEAAFLLKSYKTVGGLLVRRRADEARLMETGAYGAIDRTVIGTATAPSVSQTAFEVVAYQRQLAAISFYRGAIDGIAASSAAAVLSFQKSHPNLVSDGIVGPATRAELANAVKNYAPQTVVHAPIGAPATVPPPIVKVSPTPTPAPSGIWAIINAIATAIMALFSRKKG